MCLQSRREGQSYTAAKANIRRRGSTRDLACLHCSAPLTLSRTQTGNEGERKENSGFGRAAEVKRADVWVRDRTHTLDMEECLEMGRGEDLGIWRPAAVEIKKEERV